MGRSTRNGTNTDENGGESGGAESEDDEGLGEHGCGVLVKRVGLREWKLARRLLMKVVERMEVGRKGLMAVKTFIQALATITTS